MRTRTFVLLLAMAGAASVPAEERSAKLPPLNKKCPEPEELPLNCRKQHDTSQDPTIRNRTMEPYCDLDPDFEKDRDKHPKVWSGEIKRERREMRRMAECVKRTVHKRHTARTKWWEVYQQAHENGDPCSGPASDNHEKQQACRDYEIYKRNFGELSGDPRSREAPILSGRAVHFKGLGCFLADVTVVPPSEPGPNGAKLSQGIFASEKTYTGVVRYSNGSSRFVTDWELSSNGMAVKLLRNKEAGEDDYSYSATRRMHWTYVP
jgi:hypothetical protein